MKTIIQVWTQYCYNEPTSYWGIGDAIRGTIFLFQLCKRKGYTLVVDISLHTLSRFLIPRNHPYQDLVLENKNYITSTFQDTEEFIQHSLKSKDIVLLFSNAFCDEKSIDEECKSFIRSILTPRNAIKQEVDRILNTIPSPFSALHLRLGDDQMVHNKIGSLQQYLPLVLKHREGDTILFTDTKRFKEMCRPFILSTHLNPSHIGYSKDDKIKDSLIEFFILTQAEMIKTFSIYQWVSGFVYWIHKIYDVKLKVIRFSFEKENG